MFKEIMNNQVNDYFIWLKNTIEDGTYLHKTVKDYLEHQDNVYKEKQGPFLSVITRTQGNRPEMLSELLLCMTGQINTDFEVLIMGHNLTEERKKTVEDIIADLPEWMREKVRLVPVYGGGRATPLNHGFFEAKGQYCVVLDDDDIVFEHWVEEFYQLFLKNKGRMLRTYMVTQEWTVVEGDGKNIPRACGGIKNRYCQEFDLLAQLKDNYCPQGSVAYPSYVFKEWGIKFDEDLCTLEDWDFLMRIAFLTGVSEKGEITAIYRNWKNFENSQALHNIKIWRENAEIIKEKWRRIPIILPSRRLNYYSASEIDPEETQLFYDTGDGICERNSMKGVKCKRKKWNVIFPNMKDLGMIKSIRFDPCEHGEIFIRNIKIMVVYENGQRKKYNLNDMRVNGIKQNEGVAYLKSDPQFILPLNGKKIIQEIYVTFEWENPISDAQRDAALDNMRHSTMYRELREIWHKIYKK